MSSPAPLPLEINRAAQRGELQKVVKWLRKGGLVDAFCSTSTRDGRVSTAALMHIAATHSHFEIVRELLKRGASVDLQTSLGVTALMEVAGNGCLSILRVLLQHSANPELQDNYGCGALMRAADGGHEACVKALLRTKRNAEFLDEDGRTAMRTALLLAEAQGHKATVELIRQHAAPPPAAASPLPPRLPAHRTLASPS